MKTPLLGAALLAAGALAVSGCTSYGNGYGGLSLGYGSGYGYDYGDPYYGYGYASPYYGWYDGYYYPGTGYYVYERSGTRHRWNDHQRDYWQSHGGNHHDRDNWSGYHNGGGAVHNPAAPRGSWGGTTGGWGHRGGNGNGSGDNNHHRR